MHELFDACLSPHISPHVPSEPASTAQTEPPHGYCDLHCSYSADSCRAKRYSENASDTVHRLFCRCRSPCAGLGTPLSGVRYHLLSLRIALSKLPSRSHSPITSQSRIVLLKQNFLFLSIGINRHFKYRMQNLPEAVVGKSVIFLLIQRSHTGIEPRIMSLGFSGMMGSKPFSTLPHP